VTEVNTGGTPEADPGDRPVPPYEGRKESADVDTDESATQRDGVDVGGAERPRETSGMRAEEPEETERGRVASPADEQPAAAMPEDEPDPEQGVGPAHQAGELRGEDVPENPRG
jgi:hypothetical protein